jgi:hypothetical protein
LIGLALNEEESEMIDENNNKLESSFGLKFIEKSINFKTKSDLIKTNLNEILSLSTLTECWTRHLAEWTLEYYENLLNLKFKQNELTNIPSSLLQIKNSIKNDENKELLKQKAEKRRNKLLNKINKMQTEFFSNNKELNDCIINKPVDLLNEKLSSTKLNEDNNDNEIILLGPNENINNLIDLKSKCYQCILCQEDEIKLTNESKPMILLCYIQNSRVLSFDHKEVAIDSNYNLFKKNSQLNGPYTNTCGHTMHYDCWLKYTLNQATTQRGLLLNRDELNENSCPLCESICNSVLTILPSQESIKNNKHALTQSYEEWFDQLKLIEKNSSLKSFSYNETILQLINEFSTNTYNFGSHIITNNNNTNQTENNSSQQISNMISNCSYTIQVIEQLLATEYLNRINLKQEILLCNLVKQANMIANNSSETNENVKNLISLIFNYDESNNELSSSTVTLADCDCFHFLVSLTLSSKHSYESSIERFYTFKLMLQLKSLQILNSSISDTVSFIDYLKTDALFDSRLKNELMPFLRCCFMFYWHLNESTQSIQICEQFSKDLNDFDKLINHLGLNRNEFDKLIFNVESNSSLTFLANK